MPTGKRGTLAERISRGIQGREPESTSVRSRATRRPPAKHACVSNRRARTLVSFHLPLARSARIESGGVSLPMPGGSSRIPGARGGSTSASGEACGSSAGPFAQSVACSCPWFYRGASGKPVPLRNRCERAPPRVKSASDVGAEDRGVRPEESDCMRYLFLPQGWQVVACGGGRHTRAPAFTGCDGRAGRRVRRADDDL